MKSLDSAQQWTVSELKDLCRKKDARILALQEENVDLLKACVQLRSILGTAISSLRAVDAVLEQIAKS